MDEASFQKTIDEHQQDFYTSTPSTLPYSQVPLLVPHHLDKSKQLQHLWIAVGNRSLNPEQTLLPRSQPSTPSSFSQRIDESSTEPLKNQTVDEANIPSIRDLFTKENMRRKTSTSEFAQSSSPEAIHAIENLLEESDDPSSDDDYSSSESESEDSSNSKSHKGTATFFSKLSPSDGSPLSDTRRRTTESSLLKLKKAYSSTPSMKSIIKSDKLFGSHSPETTLFFTPLSYDEVQVASDSVVPPVGDLVASDPMRSDGVPIPGSKPKGSNASTFKTPDTSHTSPTVESAKKPSSASNSVQPGPSTLHKSASSPNEMRPKDVKILKTYTRAQLEKLLASYKSSIIKKQSRIEDVERKLTAIKAESKEDIRTFNKWQARNIIPRYRIYAQTRIAMLELNIKLFQESLVLLENVKKDLMHHLKDKQKQYDAVPILDCASLIREDPSCNRTYHDIKFLEQRINSQLSMWASVKKLHVPSQNVRNGIIRDILLATNHSVEVGFHPVDPNMQAYFEKIILDERTPEGRRIRQLIDFLLDRGPQVVNSGDVSLFLNDFAEQILRSCGLSEEKERSTLRLYLYRTVYPRIVPFCSLYNTDEEIEADAHFARQIRWMREVDCQDFDVDLAFFVDRESAQKCFKAASNILTECGYFCVPTDMLHCIFTTAKMIAQMATGGSARRGMGADDFFPIFIYCVVLSDVSTIHRSIGFMKRFSSPNERMSELGYCLTSLEAAVLHLSNLSKDVIEEKRGARLQAINSSGN
eukprot:TRINITY_DN7698_c0_g1_i1.p1 TRINITY_DN7698_c0_g1~~TRINITY_DN7698_c0_g1_i1.p1  ORF type:complete len:833 (+),score=186.83 TRINITY_DN7698_c0_g1_i1:235-2499(+)